jgi:hypothetical protein
MFFQFLLLSLILYVSSIELSNVIYSSGPLYNPSGVLNAVDSERVTNAIPNDLNVVIVNYINFTSTLNNGNSFASALFGELSVNYLIFVSTGDHYVEIFDRAKKLSQYQLDNTVSIMKPYFKQAEYADGIIVGIQSIMSPLLSGIEILGILVGCIFGVIVILLVICCCCSCTCDNKQNSVKAPSVAPVPPIQTNRLTYTSYPTSYERPCVTSYPTYTSYPVSYTSGYNNNASNMLNTVVAIEVLDNIEQRRERSDYDYGSSSNVDFSAPVADYGTSSGGW